MNILITNIDSTGIFIEDIGLNIPVDSTIDLTDYCTLSDIYDSNELKSLIINHKLRIIYDNVILNKSDSLDHLTLESKYCVSLRDAPTDFKAYVRKSEQLYKLKEEMDILNNYILYGYLKEDYILSSFKLNNLNNFEINLDNTSYFDYDNITGRIKFLRAGKYYISYNLLIYNLLNEKNVCYAQIKQNDNVINGTVITCHLDKIKYNIRNLITKDEYTCGTIKDSLPISCNVNDEIYIQIKSIKSCKIDLQGTKFIINKIG